MNEILTHWHHHNGIYLVLCYVTRLWRSANNKWHKAIPERWPGLGWSVCLEMVEIVGDHLPLWRHKLCDITDKLIFSLNVNDCFLLLCQIDTNGTHNVVHLFEWKQKYHWCWRILKDLPHSKYETGKLLTLLIMGFFGLKEFILQQNIPKPFQRLEKLGITM